MRVPVVPSPSGRTYLPPVSRAVALVVWASALAVLAACGSTGKTSAPPASEKPVASTIASDVGRYFSIVEVGLGPKGWVTLRNYTDSPASLDTLYLCQPPACVDLPDVVVEPGAFARITVGDGSGLKDVAMTNADLELAPADGEVALYSTDDVADLSRLWAYLEWGSTPHAGTAAAVKAGLWFKGSYAPTAADATRLYQTDVGLWVFE